MTDSTQTAYLAGGCFWGMEELARQIPGVLTTEVGYCGGSAQTALYDCVKTGATSHAETLKVVFDPSVLSYAHLLFEFFRIHNPTTRNRQGNDLGAAYRSVIFYTDEVQRQTAATVIKTVDTSGEWQAPVVTELVAYPAFYPAENHHQKYLQKHPQGYTCHYLRDFKLGETVP